VQPFAERQAATARRPSRPRRCGWRWCAWRLGPSWRAAGARCRPPRRTWRPPCATRWRTPAQTSSRRAARPCLMPGAPMPSRGHCRSSDPRHTQHHTEGQRCSHHQRSDAHPSHRQVSGCSRSCTLGKLGQSSVTNGTVRAAESADPTEVCRRGAAARSGWRRGCPPTRWRRRAAALRQRWPAAWRMRTRACAWPRSRRWTRWCCR